VRWQDIEEPLSQGKHRPRLVRRGAVHVQQHTSRPECIAWVRHIDNAYLTEDFLGSFSRPADGRAAVGRGASHRAARGDTTTVAIDWEGRRSTRFITEKEQKKAARVGRP